ncbi:hypothetical protein ORI89_11835 [Sphingobacterium sp. UT-1RO-CII-1]|uniref:hypothetical protein n=1 Tax=Sphingobacterium sp. UT-1RO-CII-1 TaxID=2995225 RepID=UPI00227C27AE|nr:hypothetical protein [Sphingobacterium sp. UT-1RO-CII-1]MCY4780344.1 hypothetical protein [Sphingobacterium sp. UT-1RO-CII-1]
MNRERIPKHWYDFIKIFQKKFDSELVYEQVRVFQNEEDIKERYETYDFEEYLPNYLPVADDSGGQVAVIAKGDGDTKVYLTSYGTLQEEGFKVLDRDLLHWMQRSFPFDRENERDLKQSPEQQVVWEQKSKELQAKVEQWPMLLDFWKQYYVIENLSLPEYYPEPGQVLAFQAGYAFNAVSGESLQGGREEDFKESWLVVAANYFADPFFIDFNEAEEGFPVYFAFHGAGRWTPIKVADTIAGFQERLRIIFDNKFDQAYLLDFVRDIGCEGNAFWEEVYQAVLDMPEYSEDDEIEQLDRSDWAETEVYITALGPNKMKIVALLKEKFKLSGPEALKLSKQDRVFYHKGPYKWALASAQELEALGATVEVVKL